MYIYTASTLFFYLSYLGLDKYFPEYFPDSSKESRLVTREYRIVNFVKGAALAGLSIPGTNFLYLLTFYPELLSAGMMNSIGAVYVATDLSAIAYNPSCHRSTLIHHIVVQFFYYYCYYCNFNIENEIVRGIGIYCILSAYAGIVNMRLALRCPSEKYKALEGYVNEVSIFIYITVSVINWIVQSYLILSAVYIGMLQRLLYTGTLAMTVNDDLFLIKYLRNF